MTERKRFLFAITDGGGTVPPDTSVIRALVARGHEVRVLADRVLAADVEPTGAEHVAWRTAPQRPGLGPQQSIIRDWEAKTPLQAFAAVRDGLMTGPAARFAADLRDELRRRPAEAVVGNMFLLGAQVGAEAEGVSFAFLAPNVMALPGWGVPPLGPGLPPAHGRLGRVRDAVLGQVVSRVFDRGLTQLNEARREHGLASLDGVLETYERADRLLVLTSRAFEYECFSPPANVSITGPRLDDPAWAGTWSAPPGDEPLVLVAMSSTYMAHSEALQRSVSALGELPVRGVVTTGPAIAVGEIEAPPNVTILERAPHSEILREAAAVISHGGHGTVIKSLAAGVPLVVVPLGRDQLDNAQRVAHHGAGLRLRSGAAPAKVAAAVARVLGEPGFAASASRIAAAIAHELSCDRAVEELELLAGAKLRAPAGRDRSTVPNPEERP